MNHSHPFFAALLSLALPMSIAAQEPVPEEPAPQEQGEIDTPQDPSDPESQQKKAEAVAALVKALADQGVELDLENRRVSLEVQVGRPTDPLEYLLITPRGKDHEALLVTEIQPSMLNAAFLTLGLEKGTNASTKDIEPMPTEEEIRAGAPWFEVIPPEGQKLFFSVEWSVEGENGELEQKRAPIEDWILDFSTERPLEECEWIYLGGRMGPLNRGEDAVFLTDYTGDLISLCYRDPANHLITPRHEKANNDDIWWLTNVVPEPGTIVKLSIDLEETPMHRERNERVKKERAERERQAFEEADSSGGDGDGGEGGGTSEADNDR
ncbi:MAG: YdjY domain-containing protein [Planctomycetota bacterium]